MSSYHPQEMYHDNSAPRSPGSLRHQQATLNRQPSRQFGDGFSTMPNGLYGIDDRVAQGYGLPRFSNDRLNATLSSTNYPGYDMGGVQAWNSFGHSQNSNLPTLGATNRLKPAAGGRAGLPSVSSSSAASGRRLLTLAFRAGLIRARLECLPCSPPDSGALRSPAAPCAQTYTPTRTRS